MNLKIGNDIIETERIRKAIEMTGKAFKDKVYTAKEVEYCESKKLHKFESYAGKFAAKEAVFKAISAGLKNKFDISLKDIEILNDELGRPYVILANVDYINDIDVTVSHLKEYAIATAIVEFKS